ncbi:MAG: GGDEF domain-containing protein [Defluviitaleaceae bacterium]|nr:GGDEF domain-containing protein [Defluviitaleaceae bacterium]
MIELLTAVKPQLSSNPLENLTMIANTLSHATGGSCFVVAYKSGNFRVVTPNAYPGCFDECDIKQSYATREPVIKDGFVCVPITPQNHHFDFEEIEDMRQYIEDMYPTGFVCISGTIADPRGILADVMELNNLIATCLEFYTHLHDITTDKLTGALTRKYMEQALETRLKSDSPFALIMGDMDFFKHINDNFGHAVGDDVLRFAADNIRKNLGEKGVLGRYGGEEFVIMLDNADTPAAEEFAENLRLSIQDADILEGKRDVTISLGIAVYPAHGNTIKTLTDKADKALYVAKNSGRNKYQTWQDDFDAHTVTKTPEQEFFTGDADKDARHTRSLYKIMSISAGDVDGAEKISLVLDEIANNLMAIDVAYYPKNKPPHRLKASNFLQHNLSLVEKTMAKAEIFCEVDWDNKNVDNRAGFYNWQSVIVVPAVINGEIAGVLYVSTSVASKAFTRDEAGYAYNVAQLAAMMMDRG